MNRMAPPPGPDGDRYDKVDLVETTRFEALRETLRAWGVKLAFGCGVATLLGYLVVVTVILHYVPAIKEARLRWIDVALAPLRWSEFREKQGRGLNELGLQQLKVSSYNEAYFNLRVGVARAPRDSRARLALASMSAAGNVRLAETLIDEGVALDANDVDLARAQVDLWWQFGALQRVTELATRAQALPADSPVRRALLIRCAQIMLERKRPAESLTLLSGLPPEVAATAEVVELKVRALLDSGARAESRALLESGVGVLSPLQRTLLDCDLSAAEGDEARLHSILRRLPSLHPDSVQPWIIAYYSWHRCGRTTFCDQVESDFLTLYGGDSLALRRFGAFLVTLDEPATLLRFIGQLEARGYGSFELQVLLTEHALSHRQFEQAFTWLQKWEPVLARYKGAERSYPEFVRRLTRAANDESAAQATLLGTYLAGLPSGLAYPRYMLALQVLDQAGMVEGAATLAEQALRRFSMSEALAAQHADLSRRAWERREAEVRQRLAAAAEAQQRFADANAVITAAREQWRSGSHLAARTALRELRAARPIWLLEREREIASLEMHLAVVLDEPPAARMAARLWLQRYGDDAASLELLTWAAELETSRPALASMLRQEVATHGTKSTAVAARLEAANWEDSAWRSVRTGPSALAGLDEALARRDPDQVVRLISLVKRQGPDWLAVHAGAISLREAQARLQLHQRSAAAALIRDVVRRSAADRKAAERMIRDLALAGNYDDAVFFATEWKAFRPEDEDAIVLLGTLLLKAPL